MIVMAILLSACQLMEEPTQQAKSALGSGDIVFDAQDLSKTAVMRCNNDRCGEKTLLPYMLHQVTLSDEEIAGVLQFDNLHVSFEADNKHYTCLRASVPLGWMTLLWRADDDKHCYEQDKAKAYVQQFAAACVKEKDWQLVPEVGLKKFVCKKDDITISSDCFVAGQSCTSGSWPTNIKEIHVKMGTKASTTPPEDEKSEITAETKLKDVKIMAEWKSSKRIACLSAGNMVFIATNDKKVSMEIVLGKEQTLGSLEKDKILSDCILDGDTSPIGGDYFISDGICIDHLKLKKFSDCGDGSSYYIKITFEAKE